jgi:hypothetical protein
VLKTRVFKRLALPLGPASGGAVAQDSALPAAEKADAKQTAKPIKYGLSRLHRTSPLPDLPGSAAQQVRPLQYLPTGLTRKGAHARPPKPACRLLRAGPSSIQAGLKMLP